MASYTMELRDYIERWSQNETGLSHRERIEIGRTKLFDFYYPIYDEDFKKVFETNFIRKFYMREIGFETEELFKFQLETWLNINMPYWNKMFESELIEYDPLINSSMMVAHDKVNKQDKTDNKNIAQLSETDGQSSSNMKQDSTSSSNVKDDNFHRNISSDNPDSRLQLQTEEGKGVIEYASKIDEDKVNNNSSSTATGNSQADTNDSSRVESLAEQEEHATSNVDETEHFIQRRLGKIGVQSQAKLIQDYRQALLRVERQIHNEMQELFMLIY